MSGFSFATPAVADTDASAAQQRDAIATQATAHIVAAYLSYLGHLTGASFTTRETTDLGTFTIQPNELPDLIRGVRQALREGT